jgi:hypothetical protein
MAISDNWQKATKTSTLGTPQLTYLVVEHNDGSWDDGSGNHAESNSEFAQAILLLQSRGIDMYDIGEVNDTSRFTAAVRASSVPFAAGESAGNGAQNSILTTFLSDELGFSVTVWNAKLGSDDIRYD